MMKTASISVITVCRNDRTALEALSTHLLPLLGPRDGWVIQDGASTDGTAEWLTNLKDSRIRWVSEHDSGIYDAMNKAVLQTDSDFVLFLGADDRLIPTLDTIRSSLTDTQTLYYGDVCMKPSDKRYAGAFDGKKLARTNICQQAVFYPRSVFGRRIFDIHYPLQADWVFHMACFADPQLRFEYLPLVVAEYSELGRSSTCMDEAFQQGYRTLLQKYFPFSAYWKPFLMSWLSDVFHALPGIPPARQKPPEVPR